MATPKRPPPATYPRHKWDDIKSNFSLNSSDEILDWMLTPSFLEPWIEFRDLLPMKPGKLVTVVAPNDQEAMAALIGKTYMMMGCMAASKYDRPRADDRQTWKIEDFIECLVYQSARNLARQDEPFHAQFLPENITSRTGRMQAFCRLRGLIMLISNLTIRYALDTPNYIVQHIEKLHPAKNPSLSPIPEVRAHWRLQRLGLDELRKMVLDAERGEKEEREWLVGLLVRGGTGLELRQAGVETEKKGEEVVEGKKTVVGKIKEEEKDEEGIVLVGVGRKRAGEMGDAEARKRMKIVD